MVFDVAGALDVRRQRRAALELVEDHLVGLAHHRGEHVQPAAVRHADDDVLHAQRAAALDDLLHAPGPWPRRRRGRTAWCRGSACARKRSKPSALDQLLQDGDLALAGEGDLLVAALDALLQPGLLVGIGDVHVLHADVAAVGAPQDREDLAEGRGLEAQHVVEEDRPVVVALGEAVAGRIELAGVARVTARPSGIEIGRAGARACGRRGSS